MRERVACSLYRHQWVTGKGYVVYRMCFDPTKCTLARGIEAHTQAIFVTGHDAADYCRYRNTLVDILGTDRLP